MIKIDKGIDNIKNSTNPQAAPLTIPDFVEMQKQLGMFDAKDLNNAIKNGNAEQMVNLQSNMHNNSISEIVKSLCSNHNSTKVVLISGPSSAGKTTFAQKIGLELKKYDIVPVTISMDNYFVDRGKAPKHQDGTENLEALEALDYEQFNRDVAELIKGKEVEVPVFSFKTAKRLPQGVKMQLKENQMLIVEGIHALNPRVTSLVDEDSKVKVYICPLNSVTYGNNISIHPSNVRFLRRLVRDNKFRSSSAANTFEMWTSVAKGEIDNIKPFKDSADIKFNTSILYELCILKKYAIPLLQEIDSTSDKYKKAQELLNILSYFDDMDDSLVPNNSLLREFIGGSIFKY